MIVPVLPLAAGVAFLSAGENPSPCAADAIGTSGRYRCPRTRCSFSYIGWRGEDPMAKVNEIGLLTHAVRRTCRVRVRVFRSIAARSGEGVSNFTGPRLLSPVECKNQ